MRFLIVILLFNFFQSTGQGIIRYGITLDSNYHSQVFEDSLPEIEKRAMPVAERYGKKGPCEVDIKYMDGTIVLMVFDSLKKLRAYTEFYPDTSARRLRIKDSGLKEFKIYEWWLGYSRYEEFQKTDGSYEYWWYGENDELQRVLNVYKGDLYKFEIETIYHNFVGHVTKLSYDKTPEGWVLKSTEEYIDE